MNSDIYIEMNGKRIAEVQNYTAGPNIKGQFDITLTYPCFTDEAVQDDIHLYDLNDFSLIICKPNQNKKIVYSGCRWSNIKEIGTPSNMATIFIYAVAKYRKKYKLSMEIKNHKTGKIFKNVREAVEHFCTEKVCSEDCPFNDKVPQDYDCINWAIDNPDEAIKLMGYEASELESEYTASSKPLNEWTLEEAKDYCEHTICSSCLFYDKINSLCLLSNKPPKDWKLNNKTDLTDKEIEDAKNIAKLFKYGFEGAISRSKTDCLNFICEASYNQTCIVELDSKLFPSIKCGESINIEDVLKNIEEC